MDLRGNIKIISVLDSQISSAPVHGARLLQASILRNLIRCRQIEVWKVAYAGDIVARVQTYRYYSKIRWIAHLGLGVNILDQDARMIWLLGWAHMLRPGYKKIVHSIDFYLICSVRFYFARRKVYPKKRRCFYRSLAATIEAATKISPHHSCKSTCKDSLT